MYFTQPMLLPALQRRRLLTLDVAQSHLTALNTINMHPGTQWRIELGEDIIFDLAGLQCIKASLQQYQGTATRLSFTLCLLPETARDYYSPQLHGEDTNLRLPIVATQANHRDDSAIDTMELRLPCITTPINYPASLATPEVYSTPLALLLSYTCDHDLLFANQIAIFANLANRLRRSPRTWLKGLVSRLPGDVKKRMAQCYTDIHPTAQIHPTAVIEGSVIGSGCRIGAHCVVRYSVLGEQVQLHDGAKVEYSVVDDHSWLMHDLVLYRCLVEKNVFLIHGPYQFSYFQHQSAAFASIMMDYRPDARRIRINTPKGVRDYAGRFLGALLEENAKVLGGTITAPGITIPAGKQITVDSNLITRAKTLQVQPNPAEDIAASS